MKLAELLATPAHAKALARELAVTVALFDAEHTTKGALPVVELLTALLLELAERGRELSDVPRSLAAGPRALATAVPMSEELRSALIAPNADRQLRVWADAIDSLLRHALVSEMVERAIAQNKPALVDDQDGPDDELEPAG